LKNTFNNGSVIDPDCIDGEYLRYSHLRVALDH